MPACLCTQVIDELGVSVLRDFQDHGCRVLSLVAATILQHATALQVGYCLPPQPLNFVPWHGCGSGEMCLPSAAPDVPLACTQSPFSC